MVMELDGGEGMTEKDLVGWCKLGYNILWPVLRGFSG